MIYGYARVSSVGQARDGNSLMDQEGALRNAGCEVIVSEQFTGTKMDRPEFSRLNRMLKSGDRLVVTKLDRFARTAGDGIKAIENLLNRGVSVHILNMGLIDNTPTGRLMVTMLLAFAQFERDMILERTMAGKAVAKATIPGWHVGRKGVDIPKDVFMACYNRYRNEGVKLPVLWEELGIRETTWYKLCKKYGAPPVRKRSYDKKEENES